MDAKQLTESLESLKSNLEQKQNDSIAKMQNDFEEKYAAVKDITEFKELNEKNIDTLKKSFEDQLKQVKDQYDDAIIKAQKAKGKNGNKSYFDEMAEALEKNHDQLKLVRKGSGQKLELKDMTIAANLTGDAVASYDPTPKLIPSQKINLSDIVPTINSETGIWKIYREVAKTGDFALQGTENTQKQVIDYNYEEVTYNADFLAGITRYSRQMQQDLPFLQSYLPNALRRDYYIQENALFYNALAAAATTSTQTGARIEQLILDMSVLENTNYDVNGLVVNPLDWAQIAITKPSDYSLPSVVGFINGQLVVNGVPVFKASWMPQDKYMVGDWSQAKKVAVGGLNLEFFEQDVDNVQKNMITARLEQRVVLAIERPEAFINGDFDQIT